MLQYSQYLSATTYSVSGSAMPRNFQAFGSFGVYRCKILHTAFGEHNFHALG
jgi:hypothetical protein